jgi:transcriptional regulator with XRE-family HTH domain
MTPNRRLKQARELRGWSQAKVAEQIGTDATTVSRWERGLFSPTPYFRERLCALFDKNAEELGLLETGQLPQLEPVGAASADGATLQTASNLSSLPNNSADASASVGPSATFPRGARVSTNALPASQTPERYLREDDLNEALNSLPVPSWPKRTDTFTYILHSAAHDQQAHMLWEDAYVRALRGQRAEAQQLAEASLSEFERVGHLNAAAVREWLHQRELTTPVSASTLTNAPLPLSLTGEQRKRSGRRSARRKSAGIVLILFFVLALMVAGFSFSQLYTVGPLSSLLRASSSNSGLGISQSLGAGAASRLTPTASAASLATPGATTTLNRLPTATPNAVPSTPTVIVTTGGTTSSSTLETTVKPTSLDPAACVEDSIGWRCTLLLDVYDPTGTIHSGFSWKAFATAGLELNNSSGSGGVVGETPLQVTMYVNAAQGEHGTITFTFTVPSVTSIPSVSIPWQS